MWSDELILLVIWCNNEFIIVVDFQRLYKCVTVKDLKSLVFEETRKAHRVVFLWASCALSGVRPGFARTRPVLEPIQDLGNLAQVRWSEWQSDDLTSRKMNMRTHTRAANALPLLDTLQK